MIFICLLAATFAVKAKPHEKHHGKTVHTENKKDATTEEVNQSLPTLVPYEASTQEQEEEETILQENANKDDTPSESKGSAILLSAEELEALVEKDNDDSEDNAGDAEDQVKEIVENVEVELKSESKPDLFDEADGSTDTEIHTDLDYASDSGILQQLKIQPVEVEVVADVDGKMEKKQHDKSMESNVSIDDAEVQSDMAVEAEDVEKSKNDSGIQGKKKQRKQKKRQRARKHSPQKDETQTGPEPGLEKPVTSESNSTDSTGVTKTKRRRAGKWGPLVGVNPVQIRATVELYPGTRAALSGLDLDSTDPCDNFRCKRGKTCKLDQDDKPSCVCQVPSECPPSLNELDHVCGTDNKTYDTACQLFATKCNLEGTKKGHRLHLDYTGPCKLIPQCMETELVQFPLRMRDWLKNVLLQLYKHDTTTPGFLTPKQRFRVKKIFESEKRLHAGDHSVDLLTQDFEKNYNMYIYPVHWQFAQLDKHPSDRQLSHSELAPLRVPLVPMEHCTSLFFQECDADKDKQVSFKEWTSCFGIKEEDMDTSLLF